MSNESVIPSKKEIGSARDPIRLMIEIVKDKDISQEDKAALVEHANSRFKNRRRMAYICLIAMVLSLLAVFIAAFVDSGTVCPKDKTCITILHSIKENQTLIAWIEGFFTSIVAAYYGVSSWRPAS